MRCSILVGNERNSWRGIALLAVLLAASCASLFAQSTGELRGTVYDQTGAVIPKAKIVLVNQVTQDSRQTESNDTGYFAFAAVIPSTYSLRIEASGFKAWEQKGLVISAGDKRNVADVSLQVGVPSEVVTVESSATQAVPVDSGERSALLSEKDIHNLALQGRDVTELLKVLPGISYIPNGISNTPAWDSTDAGIGSSLGIGYSANGVPNRGGTDLISDSAHIIDPGCNCFGTAMVNAEMVQEVKVQTSNFGADVAKGPVVVNAVGKSGSAAYHGELYLNVRHSALNSNTWQNIRQGVEKSDDRYLYPGGSFGGPVKIPGTNFNQNKKLLFWVGFEKFLQNLPADQPLVAFVPTPGMRAGDFTMNGEGNAELCPNGFMAPDWGNWPFMCQHLVGNLPNGQPIMGDIIPTDQIDPGGTAILKMFPLPNANPATNSGYNYFQALSKEHNGYIFRTRVDYNFTDNTKLYVSYNRQGQVTDNPTHMWWTPTFSAPFPGGLTETDISHTISANLLHVFSPSLTNEMIFTWSYVDFPLRKKNPELTSRSALGYPYLGVYRNGSTQMPSITNDYWIPGYPQVDQPDVFEFGGAFDTKKVLPTFQDNLTKVFRNHTFKFGFYSESTGNNQGTYGHMSGSIVFSPGGPWNDPLNPSGPQIGVFNPVANILLGVAGNYTENNTNPITDMAYRSIAGYANDSWKFNKRLTLDLGLRIDHLGAWYDKNKIGMAVWLPDRFASDLTGGVELPGVSWHSKEPGIPNSGTPSRFAFVSPRFGLAWDIFGSGKTVLRGGWGAYRWHDAYNDFAGPLQTAMGARTFKTNYTAYTLAELDQLGASAAGSLGGLASGVYTVDPRDDQQPVTYSYNFTFSQQLPGHSLLEMAYVGNNSDHLMLYDGLANANVIQQGALFQDDPVTGAAADPQNADLNHYAPYHEAYGASPINVTHHGGYANYNALQTSWQKQTGRITYNLNYTWSKTLGIVSGKLNPFVLRDNYGVTNIDRAHVVNLSYTLDLGSLYHGNSFLAGAANGWTIAGITTWQSGPNLQAVFSPNFKLQSTAGDPLSNRVWFGTDAISLQPMLTCNPTSQLGDNQFVNGNCFTPPPVGQNGPYQYPYISGPAFFNSDLAVYKTFKVTERQNLQFRFSAFNFLNHPLVSFNPNATGNLELKFAQNGSSYSLNNPTFGIADIKQGRRVMELALKYTF